MRRLGEILSRWHRCEVAEDLAILTAAWGDTCGPDPYDMLALEAIRRDWGAAYTLGYTVEYHAIRKTGGQSVSAATLEGLESAIRANWTRDWDGAAGPSSAPPWDAR